VKTPRPSPSPSAQGRAKRIRFGISRAHGGLELAAGAAAFAHSLEERLGQPVQLVTAKNYDHLLEGVTVGGIELAWTPPLVHARASDEGALLLAVCARGGELVYYSALVAAADGRFTALDQLAGARVAWVDPSSASGYLVPYAHLVAHGVDPRRDLGSERFLGSVIAAVEAVARGEADLAACYVRERAAKDPQAALADVARATGVPAERLRLLDVSGPIPPDGVLCSERLDGHDQARARDVLLALHERSDGRSALAQLMQADQLLPVTHEVKVSISRLRQT
jgi:phosphonate transport system substrate-binding protein